MKWSPAPMSSGKGFFFVYVAGMVGFALEKVCPPAFRAYVRAIRYMDEATTPKN